VTQFAPVVSDLHDGYFDLVISDLVSSQV
jgi:hypothetical protein